MAPGELSALPSGEKVFIDSNILTYHLLNDPVYGKGCKEFIGRVENREFEGFISPIIVSETLFNFISESEVEECYKAIKDYALLTNDAFHVATMKRYGITNIATNDPDFERVNGTKVWKP
ncbi:MAG: PIN domain-containing protein [Methanophagales archaeon]|nr:PIN domain-containing protein [Methanophagales archaeon]